jgi:outer membrane receptor protein involved in Fe transport
VTFAKTSLNRAALKSGTATLVLAMLSTSVGAMAQTTAANVADEEAIVVTGSLIKNPNLVLSSPVSVIGAETIAQRQIVNAEQLLRDLPGVVPNIGSAVNNGNGGASFVDLRGLGPNRNLVLLDGNRIAPANSSGQVDLNNIPLALVSRVDVLTGGASTTYGADAISGVVNFVTRQDFSGVDARFTYGLTEAGDGQTLNADVTIGGNFDEGRGNATISLGYQKTDPVFQGNRTFSENQVSSTNGRAAGGSPTSTPTSFSFGGAFNQLNPNATALVPQYNDFNFAPFNIFQTPVERFNIFAQAKYEIVDGIEVYGRGLFSKNTVRTIIAPSGVFGESLTIPINNPFLSPTVRAQLCAQNATTLGGTAGSAPIAPENCTATSTGVINAPPLYRRTTEVGPRLSDFVTTVFDYRAGVRGDITSTIGFDVNASYGESSNAQTLDNYVLRSRIQQSLNVNPTTGACTVTTGGCVPVNLFGPQGSITEAQAKFLRGQSVTIRDTSIAQVRGQISGDFGAASPFGTTPIGFAVGAEYRDYGAKTSPDILSQIPGELGGAGGAVLPLVGGYTVTEGFGEIVLPLLEDMPFAKSLTIEAGIRQSHYEIDAVGDPSYNATTWKVAGTWQPVDDIKIRSNYQRAVRAPNIGELFAPVTTGLTSLTTDPCQLGLPVGNAQVIAACIAQGATAAQIGTIPSPAAGQANQTSGGNPFVGPETADTFSVGAVFTPTFFDGFTASIDYYKIIVNGAITNPTPSDVLNACFGALPGATTTPACTATRRNPATGGLSGSVATTAGLPLTLSNNGRLETSGIDFTFAYAYKFDAATLSLALNGNWTDRSRFQATPSSINRECVGKYSINCSSQNGSIQPEWSFQQRTTLAFDSWNVSLLWRYIDSVQQETGAGFTGTVTGIGPLVGTQMNAKAIRAYHYFDLGAGFNITENLTLNMLIANLANEQPPQVGSTIGTTGQNSGNTYPSTYDTLGRRYSVTVGLKF